MRLSPPRVPFELGTDLPVLVPRVLDGLPEADAAVLARLPEQIATEADAIRRELGARPVVVDEPPARGPVWFIGPSAANPHLAALGLDPADTPTHHLDRDAGRLVTDAPDAAGILQAFAFLRTLARHPGGPLEVDQVHSVREAVERVLYEVHDTWAGFGLRDVDWTEVSRRHVWRVLGATNPVLAMQRWLAELGDFHTWLRPARTQLVLPYGATVVDGEVMLTHVFPWTEAARHGVGPGWRLVGEDVAGTWRSTPGAPHAKPQLVARRILSGDAGRERHLEARGPGGRWARWSEVFTPPTGPPATWEVLPSGAGFLWVGAWLPGLGIEETIEEALTELQGCDRLIVDLRGNSGGRLQMAQDFRDRFLTREGPVGWIQSTQPGGGRGPIEPLLGRPSDATRWHRPVRFLTSPLSYSSTEDALLGLQGLDHVEVVGEPSGGGSGRLRRLRILPGWRLTISSALTWDLRGRCIEGAGIPVDRYVVPDRRHPDGADPVFAAADQLPW